MAACSLFDEDEVCLVTPDKGCVYGLVLENSEFVSSDEEGDDLPGQIKRGTVRVAWHPHGRETVVQEDKVILADRSLMPGDVVRRLIQNEDSQRGFVEDMTVLCHIHILGTDKYIYNVDSKQLIPIMDFDPDPGEVTLDSWVGRIDTVNEDIILRFPDGARCVINDSDVCGFEDASEKRGRHTEFCNRNNYPGQELKGMMGDLVEVEWLTETLLYNSRVCGSKPKMSVIAVVDEVKTKSVEVHWLCRGFSKVENPLTKMDPPESCVTGEDLKRLSALDWFAHCSVQIGDKAYYVIKDSDHLDPTPPKRHFVPAALEKLTLAQVTECTTTAVLGELDIEASPTVEGAEKSVNKTDNAVKTNTAEGGQLVNGDINSDDEYEDVEDSDSDADSQASGHSSISSSNVRKKRSRKGPNLPTKMMKRVRGRRAKKKMKLPERVLTPGDKVAVEICYTFSRASVMWQDGTEEHNIPSPELYPIHHLDELEFFPGDFVVDSRDPNRSTEYGIVVSCNHRDRTCQVQWVKPYEVGKSNKPEEIGKLSEVSVYDTKDHPDYKFRPGHSVIRVGGFEKREQELQAVGQVFRLNSQGTIEIKWPDATKSLCYPQELYIVADDLSDYESSEWDSSEEEEEEEEEETDASWETENEEEIDGDSDEAKDSDKNPGDDDKSAVVLLCEHKKRELDSLLERALTALCKLEDLFLNLDHNAPNVSTCYHDILRIYRNCKDLDKILKSSYFDEEEITDLISTVKAEIKKEKSLKVAKHLVQLYESWHKGLADGDEEGAKEGGEESRNGKKNEQSDSENFAETKSMTENFAVHLASEVCGSEVSDFEKHKSNDASAQNCDIVPCLQDFDLNKSDEATCLVNGTENSKLSGDSVNCIHGKNDSSLTEPCQEMLACKSSSDQSLVLEQDSKPSENSPGQNAKDLCLKICHQLHVRMSRIHEEVIQRWKKDGGKSESTVETADVGSSVDFEPLITENGIDSGDISNQISETFSQSGDPGLLENCVKLEESNECQKKLEKQEQIDMKAGDDSQETDIAHANGLCSVKLSVKNETPSEGDGFQGESLSETTSRGFQMEEEALLCHRYRSKEHSPVEPRSFMAAVRKELKLLRTSLPEGIMVKGFEDRMDLFSVMIVGPAMTPYEDGLFFFDVQLPTDYPSSPPSFHYLSYCPDRLNPNLYEDGKVCISLLGTWSGKGSEVWTSKSNLLQVLISIQGLILVGEPYYNEAGYERQRGTQQGHENSRMYNEMAVLKLVQSLTKMVRHPPKIFEQEAREHLIKQGPRMLKRLQKWIEASETSAAESALPESLSPNQRASVFKEELEQKTINSGDNDESSITGEISETTAAQNNTDHEGKTDHEHQGEITHPVRFQCSASDVSATSDASVESFRPDFPLLPASKGFCLTVAKYLVEFKNSLEVLEVLKAEPK